MSDSPRVEGTSITVQFIVSRAAKDIECFITGRQRMNCKYLHSCIYLYTHSMSYVQEYQNDFYKSIGSSGEMTFSNLEPGRHTLRIVARNSRDDRAAVSRRFFISNGTECAIHLINSGLSVYGDNAKVEFATSGLPVTQVLCTVDSREFPCRFKYC